jgi:hypothetical protein
MNLESKPKSSSSGLLNYAIKEIYEILGYEPPDDINT